MPAKDTIALSNSLDDVELRTVALQPPINRTMSKDAKYTEEYVDTSMGQVLVAYSGDRSLPAILTYHDLGLNYISNFQAFFNYPDLVELTDHFSVYHITAPGQEEGALPLPSQFEYPTMEILADQVQDVINHFNITRYVGIGVGLGANVLLRHAQNFPERVDCLLLINATSTKSGWIEWGYQKRNANHLINHGVTQSVIDYLMWHHFGSFPDERPHDLVSVYKHYFEKDVSCVNLARLVEQYVWRSDIALTRDGPTLEVPVLNIVGSSSPFIDDTVTLNGRLAPQKTNWIKLQEAAMVLEEQPGKVCEAFRLFLQGQGFCLKIRKLSVQGLSG